MTSDGEEAFGPTEDCDAAVLMLAIEATRDKVQAEVRPYCGDVFQTSLSKHDEEKRKQALQHDNVKGCAHDLLDLDEAEAAAS